MCLVSFSAFSLKETFIMFFILVLALVLILGAMYLLGVQHKSMDRFQQTVEQYGSEIEALKNSPFYNRHKDANKRDHWAWVWRHDILGQFRNLYGSVALLPLGVGVGLIWYVWMPSDAVVFLTGYDNPSFWLTIYIAVISFAVGLAAIQYQRIRMLDWFFNSSRIVTDEEFFSTGIRIIIHDRTTIGAWLTALLALVVVPSVSGIVQHFLG